MLPFVLITGSTGYIGGRLKQRLEELNYPMRCLIRSNSSIPHYCPASTQYIVGDVRDKKKLLQALDGVDVAYYLIHSMGEKVNFTEVDRKLAVQFAETAALAKVKKIIYLSGLGNQYEMDLSSHSKCRQEVGHVLRANSNEVQVIEFRTSMVIGSGSLSFEMIRSLVDRLPIMVIPKWASIQAQPIAIEDLITYLVKAIDCPLDGNPIFEIGGKDKAGYRELMREYADQKGLKRQMVSVPFAALSLSSLWLSLITPLYARVGKKLVESAIVATTVHDPLAAHIFNMKAVGCKDAIAAALANKIPETRWNDAASSIRSMKRWSEADFGGRLTDVKREIVDFHLEEAFAPIRKIGGGSGYYGANWLWKIRGVIDFVLGGVGFRRGRRDPENIKQGDVIDFWRVIAYQPNKQLKLLAEMKTPGRAILEFSISPKENGLEITQKAIFDPIGPAGILYWYFLYPVHQYIFRKMFKGIINKMGESS